MDLDKAWLYRQGNWTQVDDPELVDYMYKALQLKPLVEEEFPEVGA